MKDTNFNSNHFLTFNLSFVNCCLKTVAKGAKNHLFLSLNLLVSLQELLVTTKK